MYLSACYSFIAIDMIAQVASSYFVYWTHKAKDVINAQKYNILKEGLLLMEKLFIIMDAISNDRKWKW